jgi:hypothetical protein
MHGSMSDDIWRSASWNACKRSHGQFCTANHIWDRTIVLAYPPLSSWAMMQTLVTIISRHLKAADGSSHGSATQTGGLRRTQALSDNARLRFSEPHIRHEKRSHTAATNSSTKEPQEDVCICDVGHAGWQCPKRE